MKNPAILLFALLFFPVTLSSQRQCVLLRTTTIGSDTLYSLGIAVQQLDSVRISFLRTYGTPVSDTYGTMIWKGVSLQSLGEQLEIHYMDWLCTMRNKYTSCKYFKSEADKVKKVAAMKENQHRAIWIDIKDASGRNILTSRSAALEAAKLFGGTCK
jgi:hypothetical protein